MFDADRIPTIRMLTLTPGIVSKQEQHVEDSELTRLANARDLRGLAALLAPCGQTLPDPNRLYRGLGLDEAELDVMLMDLAAGKGVASREIYSPERLADFAVNESVALGCERVRALFKDKTRELDAALSRLESALDDVKCLLRAQVALRVKTEPELEARLFEQGARSYVLGEIPPYAQSAARGGADGIGAGCALFFAVEKGLKEGKHSVVVEFDRPASGVIEVGVYPSGIHEFVILGRIPGPTVRAVWVEGRRFTPSQGDHRS